MKIYVSTNSLFEGIHSVSEPLFLNPDGNRTRFPIGWEGKGRYIPNSLKLVRMSDNTELDPNTYAEEANGVFFNFVNAPASGAYTDIEVRYLVRPDDYAFSLGTEFSAYPGEEYFLFPNWRNAKGCGDAFWIGKYDASRADATISSQGTSNTPVSKKNKCSWVNTAFSTQIGSCSPKGDGFHAVRNREWMSMVLWTREMGIDVYGNFAGYTNNGSNIDLRNIGTNITASTVDLSANPTEKGSTYVKILTGAGPVSFRHNGKAGGISDICGNVWTAIDGLQLRDGVPYILNDDNTSYVALTGTDIVKPTARPYAITYINNRTEDILNEGLPVASGGISVSGSDDYWKPNNDAYTGTKICYRGGSCGNGSGAGVWALSLGGDVSHSCWDHGFRLARSIN